MEEPLRLSTEEIEGSSKKPTEALTGTLMARNPATLGGMTSGSRRSFGSIRRLASGRFQARYTCSDGKLFTAPSTFGKKLHAEAWLVDRKREIDLALWNPAGIKPESVLFSDYAPRWLTQRRTAGRPLKKNTSQQYRRMLDIHLLPEFGDRKLASITSVQIKEWHAALLPDSPASRAYCYRLMKSIMRQAVTDELIAVDPCRVKRAGTTEQVHRTVVATVAELELATQAMPPCMRLAVSLSSWCALRSGEVRALVRSDLDLNAMVLHVRRGVVQLTDGLHVDTPKS